jgi:hypothetical protein
VGFLNNKALLAAIAISVFSTLLVIYLSALHFLFQTISLELTDLILVIILSLSGFLLIPEILFTKKLRNNQ